jgi:hypothetical protein
MSYLTRVAAFAAIFVAASCTADNPHYVGDVSSEGDGGAHPDLASADGPRGDLAGRDLAMADLTGAAACMPSTRSCGAMGSEACASGVLVPDRMCPNASVCTSGYCAPPPSPGFGATVGRSCAFNGKPNPGACTSFANDSSCQPFLDPGDPNGPVHWTCDKNVGSGGSGVACSSGSTCSTGFCGSNGTCLMPCDSDTACFSFTGGNNWRCQGVTVVVEGRTLQTKSCIVKQ